jgi:spore coat polysaccharide biosynthesis protein SpsF (cytidylyltransferase family)
MSSNGSARRPKWRATAVSPDVPRRLGILVFARMSSRRLPGKALLEIGGRPMLEHVLRRLGRVAGVPPIVVATSDRAEDDAIAAFASRHGAEVFRGDLADVAGRALAAAEAYGLDAFVRISGDSPFLDPALVAAALARHAADRPDVTTNVFPRSYPPGCSVEVVERSALAQALPRMTAEEQEHVTLHFYRHAEACRIVNLVAPAGRYDGVHLAVDSAADLARARAVAAALGDRLLVADLDEVAALARANDPRASATETVAG